MDIESVFLDESKLDDIPSMEAVYAIFSHSIVLRDTKCKCIGETDNLQQRTREHFSKNEKNSCLLDFMQSKETKLMIYELMPHSTKDDRLKIENEWIERFNPELLLKF